MNILLISDRESVAKSVIDHLKRKGKINQSSYNKMNLPEKTLRFLHCYKYKRKNIDLIITGTGMANSAYFTGRLLSLKHYDLIIHFGLASALSKKLEPGQVVNVFEDNFGDIGFDSSNGLELISETEHVEVPENAFYKKTIYNKTIIEGELTDQMESVSAVTVNTVYKQSKYLSKIKTNFKPDIISLDGAAIAHIANLESIALLQIRAINHLLYMNDYAETEKAIFNLNQVVRKLIDIIE